MAAHRSTLLVCLLLSAIYLPSQAFAPNRACKTAVRIGRHGILSSAIINTATTTTTLSMSTDDSDGQGLGLKRIKIGDQDFWTRQKELMNEMTDSNQKSLKDEMRDKFAKRRLALVGDTAYFGFFIFCILWSLQSNPFVAFSYAFGASMGLAYAYGLGRYVETLGESADNASSLQGAGVGEARFAFLILLFVIVGRFRDVGLQEIPAIAGFFTYQLASLSQGLREIND
jgi:hypothetical protein